MFVIKSKQELQYYMEADAKAYGKSIDYSLKQKIVNILFPDYNYEFMKCLRKLEYHINRGG